MGYTISGLPNDTALIGQDPVDLAGKIPLFNYGADFEILSNTGSEVVALHMGAEPAHPFKIRWAVQPVADIYKGRPDIAAEDRISPSTGTSALVEVSLDTLVQDQESNDLFTLPLRATLILQLPTSSAAHDGAIETMVCALIGALVKGDETPEMTTGIARLRRRIVKDRHL